MTLGIGPQNSESDTVPVRSISHETDLSHCILQEMQTLIDRYKTQEFVSPTENECNKRGGVGVVCDGQVAGSSQCSK